MDEQGTPQGSRGRLVGIVAAVVVAATLSGIPRWCRADDLFILRDTLYELSPIYTGGYFFFPGKGVPNPDVPFRLSGIRIHERNGLGGKLVAGSIVAIVLGLASSDREYVGSTYGYGYRIDWYRIKSPEELKEEQKMREEMIGDTMKNDYQMDLQFFFPIHGVTTGRGFSWSLLPWSYTLSQTWPGIIEFGFILHHIEDYVGPCAEDPVTRVRPATCAREKREKWHYLLFGTPIRFIAPITRWAYFDLAFHFNYLYWLNHKRGRTTTHEFYGLFTLNPIERLFVRGGAIISGFSSKGIAYTAEAGVRF